MTLAQFSRLCESIEHLSPTQKINRLSNELSVFDNVPAAVAILSIDDLPENNIAEKRAIKWIANAIGLFEDEIESQVDIYGDLGEALLEMDFGKSEDSNISMSMFFNLLILNCSSMDSENYRIIRNHINEMSSREIKWFVRYWLRKPRNGINNSTMVKVIDKRYAGNNVKKLSVFYPNSELEELLSAGKTVKARLVHGSFVKPMLAKPYAAKHKPDNEIIDVKYDGNRYQIHSESDIIIFNRKGKIVTSQFPDVVDWVQKIDKNFIVDAEIYPINNDGSPAEHKLMAKRVHKKDVQEAMDECPVRLAVFDVLSSNGLVMLDEPLFARIEELDKIIPEEHKAYRFSEEHNMKSAYNIAINRGFEGVMLKDADLTYQSGKRSVGWLKHKPPRIDLDVVIVSAQYGKGKRAGWFGSFGIAVKDGSDYVNVGNCGTGFSEDNLMYLTNHLRKSIESYEGDTYYVLPRIVLQVSCDLISKDSDGNVGLRFPRCVRIRTDKFPSDIDTLQRVKELM
jgi:DNA ligase-1